MRHTVDYRAREELLSLSEKEVGSCQAIWVLLVHGGGGAGQVHPPLQGVEKKTGVRSYQGPQRPDGEEPGHVQRGGDGGRHPRGWGGQAVAEPWGRYLEGGGRGPGGGVRPAKH